MMPRKEVAIGFAADENVALGLYVAIFSVLANLSEDVRCSIYIADGGLAASTKEKLEALGRTADSADVTILDVSSRAVDHLRDPDYVGRGTYLRFLIPENVRDQHERLIYLDTDVLVLKDISEMYFEDMRGHSVLACQDYIFPTIEDVSAVTGLAKVSDLSADTPYLNSGVLLIDTERWEKEAITERSIAMLETHPDHLALDDQDALNATLQGYWGILDPVWNVQLNWVSDPKNTIRLKPLRDAEARRKVLKDPGVLHYNYMVKPWDMGFAGPYRRIYLQYLKASGYMGRLEYTRWLAQKRVWHAGKRTYRGAAAVTRPYRHRIASLLRGRTQ
jgi:lipopolysaccharide biosynthesis glycosyltransferase